MTRMTKITGLALALSTIGAAAVAQTTVPTYAIGFGPNPVLPAPQKPLLPTVNVAPAEGWPAGATPVAASGMAVTAYAAGLDHPRWLYVLPNGDVLVAETNKPVPTEKEASGIKAAVTKFQMKRAGAGVASANRITLLRGVGADGAAASKTTFLEGLNSPFGMALVGNDLYIANADAVLRFPYQTGETRIAAKGEKVIDLPAGINHHWTKNIVASPDGKRLYVSVGSNSNIGETAWTRKKAAPRSGKSTAPAARAGCSRAACAIPSA